MNYQSKRWIILIAGFFINICAGSGYAWSVFQGPLMQKFGWSAVEASLAFTFLMVITTLPMALVGKAQDYVQPRILIIAGGILMGGSMFLTGYVQSLTQLYLIYGVGCGIGQGIIYPAVLSNMVRLFPDKRGLCAGVMAAGLGFGTVIIAPLAVKLIAFYGVMAAFKIIGIVFVVVVCGLSLLIDTAPVSFRPEGWSPKETVTIISGVDKNWREILKDPVFYLIAGILFTGSTSGMMIIGHASPMLQEIMKFTPQKAAALVGFLALCNTLGRIFWGCTSDRMGRLNTIFLLFLISGISLFGLVILAGNYLFVVFMMLLGLCYGGFMAMIASLTADAFGAKHLPVNFGIIMLAYGLASFVGPRMAAVVKMINNGDYSLAFIIAIVFCGLGILLNFITMKQMNKVKRPVNLT